MGDRTGIPWTDATWNPVVGCSHASPGCTNCYAETMARRLRAMGRPEYQDVHDGRGWTGRTSFVADRLDQPLRWKKPRRIFVCSMGDLFHESVTDGQILRVLGIAAIGAAQHGHTFQVLTKRPARMLQWFRRWADLTGEPTEPQLARGPEETRRAHPSPRGQMFAEHLETLGDEPPPGCAWPTFDWMGGMKWWPREWPTHGLWLGVTAEDQRRADERIPLLLQCPAEGYFVSAEPLLSSLTLPADFLTLGPRAWCIAGGESGPHARPMRPEWARSLRDQCESAGVPYFFKQWGEWATGAQMSEETWSDLDRSDHGAPDDDRLYRVGTRAAGHLLDGAEHRETP